MWWCLLRGVFSGGRLFQVHFYGGSFIEGRFYRRPINITKARIISEANINPYASGFRSWSSYSWAFQCYWFLFNASRYLAQSPLHGRVLFSFLNRFMNAKIGYLADDKQAKYGASSYCFGRLLIGLVKFRCAWQRVSGWAHKTRQGYYYMSLCQVRSRRRVS